MIAVRWIYDKKDRTPEGTDGFLLTELQDFAEYVVLYYQAANSKNPEKGKCWCPDCNNNAKALEEVASSFEAEIELWRVVASWRRRDWLDENDRPVLKNPFRDHKKPWGVPGLPHTQLVKYDGVTGLAILQKSCNPNREYLQHLLSRKQFMKFSL